MALLSRTRIKREIQEWLGTTEINWNLAVRIHFPVNLAHSRSQDNKYVRELFVRAFLNKIDRRIFGNSVLRLPKLRIQRFVVEHFSSKAGYHYHFVMNVPDSLNIDNFAFSMQCDWERKWKYHQNKIARNNLFWADKLNGDYLYYITKHIGTDPALLLECCYR